MNSTVFFRSGSLPLARGERAPTTVAVDLGFAKRRKSCGLAWCKSSEDHACTCTFGECIRKVTALLTHVTEADLIIEAPLSGFFSSDGNPVDRGDLERRAATEGQKAQHRYWYSGAGAVTCLAAVFFLRELRVRLDSKRPAGSPLTITLYEGFLTFKTAGSRHDEDAKSLRNAFLRGGVNLKEVVVPNGTTVLTVADILSPQGPGSIAPAIVVPEASGMD